MWFTVSCAILKSSIAAALLVCSCRGAQLGRPGLLAWWVGLELFCIMSKMCPRMYPTCAQCYAVHVLILQHALHLCSWHLQTALSCRDEMMQLLGSAQLQPSPIGKRCACAPVSLTPKVAWECCCKASTSPGGTAMLSYFSQPCLACLLSV